MKANPVCALFRVRCSPQSSLGRAVAGKLTATFTALALTLCVSARADGVVTDCSEGGLYAALGSGGTVTFSGDCSITLSQPIDIPNGTTITLDAGTHVVTLSGGKAVSLFTVGGNLTLKGITVSGGLGSIGGAMSISPGGSVLITNCVFAGNNAEGTNGTAGVNGSNSAYAVGGDGTAGTSGTSALGGAIYNSGTLTLWNSTFVTNNASAGSGAAGGNGGSSGGSLGQGGNGGAGGNGGSAWGGAVYNAGNLTAVNCTFTGNAAAAGNGAAGGSGGSAAFPGRAGDGGAGGTASGAGIYSASNIVVQACTFSGNTCFGGNSSASGTKSNGAGNAGPNGGDASGAGLTSARSGVATNCTFFDNMVIGGNGGDGGDATASVSQAGNGGNGGNGIGASIYNASGGFTNVNCTIGNGSAVGGTNGVAGSGPFPGTDGQPGQAQGAGLANRGSFLLVNSLLSTNTPGGNGNGAFIDGGHNLSSDNSIALGATSMVNKDPLVYTLTNNGGPTMTMALRTNSPAIDAVGTNIATFPATDQRGVLRPLGKGADIGAYELATTPGIITQPQSQAQSYGGSVTFTVDATGASLHYQWRFSGTNILAATSSSYKVSNITITNAGDYQVVVWNTINSVSNGVPSSIATLTVIPYLLAAVTNQEVAVSAPANFSANATGSQPLYYQWYFNATNLLSGATATNFTLPHAQLSDAGKYTVVITNSGGSFTSAPAVLLVDSILVQPTSQTVLAGSPVTLSVVASGTSLQYTWFFNNTQLSFVMSPSFTFTATTNSAGTYRVAVGNTLVTMASEPAEIKVVVPTTISQTGVRGNQFNLAFPTQTNLSYVLESKNSLLDPTWTPLQTNSGTGNWMTNSDWTTNRPSRFYRLLIQ